MLAHPNGAPVKADERDTSERTQASSSGTTAEFARPRKPSIDSAKRLEFALEKQGLQQKQLAADCDDDDELRRRANDQANLSRHDGAGASKQANQLRNTNTGCKCSTKEQDAKVNASSSLRRKSTTVLNDEREQDDEEEEEDTRNKTRNLLRPAQEDKKKVNSQSSCRDKNTNRYSLKPLKLSLDLASRCCCFCCCSCCCSGGCNCFICRRRAIETSRTATITRNRRRRRWPNLVGLIEWFEQQQKVAAGNVGPSSSGHVIGSGDQLRVEQREHSSGMRNIITPVRFAPSESELSTTTSDSIAGQPLDLAEDWPAPASCHCAPQQVATGRWNGTGQSDNHLELHRQASMANKTIGRKSPVVGIEANCSSCNHCCLHHKLKPMTASPIERIVSRGAVQVLPSTTTTINSSNKLSSSDRQAESELRLRKRLTKTNWQPPTDARKYEQLKYLKRRVQQQQLAGNQHQLGRETSNRFSGPTIVKHQTSSSRKLLLQLARQKHLDETQSFYRARRRPENETRIEQLIEQLERATSEWDEDEHLLDRAERRDRPAAQYQEARAQERNNDEMIKTFAGGESGAELLHDHDENLLNFGCRSDVPSLEERSVAQAHAAKATAVTNTSTTWQQRQDSRSDWPAQFMARPSPIPDRHGDDLALRRLQRPADWSGSVSNSRCQSRMSYLLCPSAQASIGAMMADEQLDKDKFNLERRQHQDDLHRRFVARSSHQHAGNLCNLPFGVPKDQSTRSLAKLSASERLRPQRPTEQQQRTTTPKGEEASERNLGDHFLGFECCDCRCQRPGKLQSKRLQATQNSKGQEDGYDCDQRQQPLGSRQDCASQTEVGPMDDVATSPNVQVDGCEQTLKQRSDSRVSFAGQLNDDNEDQKSNRSNRFRGAPGGRASADSGMGFDNINSPVSRQDQSPDSCAKAAAAVDGDDDRRPLAEELEDSVGEVDLAELMAVWSPCESPALERVQAELTRAPVRRRPKIAIDKPRAKSPLLRAGSGRWKTSPLVAGSKQQHRADHSSSQDVKAVNNCFMLQTYSDSLRRKSKERKSVAEVECKYDFSDDDDDDRDDSEDCQSSGRTPTSRNSKLFVTIYESSESTPNEEDSQRDEEEAAESLRLLNTAIESHEHRPAHKQQDQSRTRTSESQTDSRSGKLSARSNMESNLILERNLSSNKANFTIGPYESLPRRHNLKIL